MIQVAKSFVDNAINKILEHWKLAPYDASDFVENCENGGQVEDEGILMAIQSHGLQSNSQTRPTQPENQFGHLQESKDNAENANVENANNLNFPHFRGSNLETSNGTDANAMNNPAITKSDETDKGSGERGARTDGSRYEMDMEIDISRNTSNLEIADSVEFLNAAVSAAIHQKGLSSYNYG